VLFNHIRRAIALPQLPKSNRTPSTSKHPFLTNHRDTEDTEKERSHTLQPQTAIAPLQPPQQRSHPSNFPNSDSYGALRYRTPSTPPNSDRTPSTSQTAIAPFNSPNSDRTPSTSKQRSHPLNSPISFFNEPQRHRGHRERAIASPQLPKSDRTLSTPKQRSHSLNSQTAIAPLQLPKQRSHPLQLPKQRSYYSFDSFY
jgi:hypothetical protein